MNEKTQLLRIETVDVSTLKPHPRNYVSHPEDQLEHIVNSIKEHGFYRNVLIARDGTLLAGHGVIEACKKLGITQVPVHRLDLDPDHPLALKVLVGDNEISHLRQVDDRVLTNLLKEIGDADITTLLGTGYDEQMLAGLLLATRTSDEIPDIDAASEWAGAEMPDYDPGKQALRIVVLFKEEKDRQSFIDYIGAEKFARVFTKDGKKQASSIWWPLK